MCPGLTLNSQPIDSVVYAEQNQSGEGSPGSLVEWTWLQDPPPFLHKVLGCHLFFWLNVTVNGKHASAREDESTGSDRRSPTRLLFAATVEENSQCISYFIICTFTLSSEAKCTALCGGLLKSGKLVLITTILCTPAMLPLNVPVCQTFSFYNIGIGGQWATCAGHTISKILTLYAGEAEVNP